MPIEPSAHLGVLVGGVIVEDYMHGFAVNAGGILQRLAGVKVQHGRKQEGPRYRGPSCYLRFIPEGQSPTADLTVLVVTGAWSERA